MDSVFRSKQCTANANIAKIIRAVSILVSNYLEIKNEITDVAEASVLWA